MSIASLPPSALIAMIAVSPLPGAPGYGGDDQGIMAQALDDLAHYNAVGVDALLLENSCDLPYVKPPLPRPAVELMQQLATEVRGRFAGPIGVQLLEAANLTALEIAAAAGLDFVRVEGYVFAHVGGAGLIEGCAGQLHRRRHELGQSEIALLADVKKKHCAHALTADLDIVDVVRQSEFFLADAIIVTGPRTGAPPDPDELRRVRAATDLPLLIGSGVTAENLPRYWPLADAFIVGSTFRQGGRFLGRLDPARLAAFMAVVQQLRGG